MRIEKVSGGLLTVMLGPDDCLTLAKACQFAADVTGEEEQERCSLASRETSYLFSTLRYLLEGYALVSVAKTYMLRDDDNALQLPQVIEEWGVVRAEGGR